jgi:hypothetical protein
MTYSESEKKEIQAQGVGGKRSMGGQPTQSYWTPDGRPIKALPDMHEFRRNNRDGTIETGVRDANLDKGWLTTPPQVKQLYCPHCDKWHKTQKDIDVCGNVKKKMDIKYTKLAQKELKVNDDSRMDKLESDMSDLKNMFGKIMEKLSG